MGTNPSTISGTILLLAWIAGVVVAKGFLSTLVAIVFPFWAWYLLIEHLMEKFL